MNPSDKAILSCAVAVALLAAAGSALASGWYLMVPPLKTFEPLKPRVMTSHWKYDSGTDTFTADGKPVPLDKVPPSMLEKARLKYPSAGRTALAAVDPYRPVGDWQIAGVFDAATQCMAAQHADRDAFLRQVPEVRSLSEQQLNGVMRYRVCVATDDPRLKDTSSGRALQFLGDLLR